MYALIRHPAIMILPMMAIYRVMVLLGSGGGIAITAATLVGFVGVAAIVRMLGNDDKLWIPDVLTTTIGIFSIMHLGLLLVALMRGSISGVKPLLSTLVMIALFTAVYFAIIMTVSQKQSRGYLVRHTQLFGVSVLAFVTVNIFAAFTPLGNLTREAQFVRDIDSILIPGMVTLGFPFSSSGQFFAAECGLLILWGILAFGLQGRYMAILAALAIVIGVMGIVLAASRAPILALFIVLSVTVFPYLIRRYAFITLCMIGIFTPILILSGALEGGMLLVLDLLPFEVERSPGDALTFSSRDMIWLASLAELANPLLIHWVGFGAGSQQVTGVVYEFATLFEHSYTEVADKTMHHSVLQTAFDQGYLGAFVMVAIPLMVIWKNGARNRKLIPKENVRVAWFCCSGMTYLMLCGATEVTVTYYSLTTWALFIWMAILASCVSRRA